MTFQAYEIEEAKYHLYDQLVPVCPILVRSRPMETLTEFHFSWLSRGYLVDTNCRWEVIAGGCDCRTPEEERGLKVDGIDVPIDGK